MEQTFEFFKGPYELRGKHARMTDELCGIKEVENNYFKRVADVYILAAIVGLRYDRKAPEDHSSEDTKKVFTDVMMKERDTFEFLLQMMLITENSKTMNSKESILKAFRGAQTKEEYIRFNQLFDDYVRGGVEELYESLVVRRPEPDEPYVDEHTANLMALLERLRAKELSNIVDGKEEKI